MSGEQTFNLNFVKEIEKHPCLYNYTIVSYSYKDVTEKAWSNVSRAVNLSVNECKERWKNLRAVFVRHKKHEKRGKAITRKRYYLEEAMEFSLPYIKTLNPTYANTSASASCEVVYEDQDEEKQVQSPDQHPPSIPSPPPQERFTNHLNKKRPYEENHDLKEDFEHKKNRLSVNLELPKDGNSLFLLSLLPDLNEMSGQQIRVFRKKVLDLIDEVLETYVTVHVKVEPTE